MDPAGCVDGAVILWSAAGVRAATLGGGEDFGGMLSLAVLSDGRLVACYGDPDLIRL